MHKISVDSRYNNRVDLTFIMSMYDHVTQTRQSESSQMMLNKQRETEHLWYAKSKQASSVTTQASMDDITLCKLLQRVFQTQEGSEDHENAKEALALAIDQIPEIQRYLDEGLRIYYEQALPVTMRDIRRNIRKKFKVKKLDLLTLNCSDKYISAQVRKSFVSWVLMILKADCKDVYRVQKGKIKTVSASDPYGEQGTIEDIIADPSLTGIEIMIQQEDWEENQQRQEEMEQTLENEIQEDLSCHPDGYSQCTCYELLKRRLLRQPPQKWKDIATELNIPFGTVTAHWNRRCKTLVNNIPENFGLE